MSQTTDPTSADIDPVAIGMVLASQAPRELASFYSLLTGRQATQGLSEHHWIVSLNEGTKLEIYRPSRSRAFPQSGRRLALCLRLTASDDPLCQLESVVHACKGAGAGLLDSPRAESFGAETWLADPEGNAVLIVVPYRKQHSADDS